MIVAVAGFPGAGKTYTADAWVAEAGATVVRTDDWTSLAWIAQPGAVLEALRNVSADVVIVEGVTVPRLLKRGWTPDLVVWVEHPDTDGESRHRAIRGSIMSSWRQWRRTVAGQAVPLRQVQSGIPWVDIVGGP